MPPKRVFRKTSTPFTFSEVTAVTKSAPLAAVCSQTVNGAPTTTGSDLSNYVFVVNSMEQLFICILF